MSGELAEDEVYCRDCGAVIKERAEICPECGIRQRDPDNQGGGKDPGIAAVASFVIPGLGQVYNGQIAKGIIAGIVTIGFAITVIGLVIAVPLWIYLVYDAYRTASDGSSDKKSEQRRFAPRVMIPRILSWYEDNGGDSDRVEMVRRRIYELELEALAEEDKAFIMEAVEAYDDAKRRRYTDGVRDAIEY